MKDYSEVMISNVLKRVEKEINEADNKDTVNKIHRQARNWMRYHCYYAEACSRERAREINHQLKAMRRVKLEELGYVYRQGGHKDVKIK